jgi:hypothetical protein
MAEVKDTTQVDPDDTDTLQAQSDDAMDFDSFGDGRSEGLDDDDESQSLESPAPKDEDKPAEGDAATGDETPDGDETIQADDAGETVTIDGEKIPIGDLTSEQLQKMATHTNQVGHYQKLADERKTELEQYREQLAAAERKNREVMDEWTRFQMQQTQQQDQQQTAEPVQRPTTEQLRGLFAGQLNAMKASGDLTEDEFDEHSGLIANYMYDSQVTQNVIAQVATTLDQRLQALEGTVPQTAQAVEEQTAERRNRLVQQEAASTEGYEDLSNPEEWNKLTEFIGNKVLSSPKDANGNPTFDPIFDAQTMREQYDAMQGAVMRSALAKAKKEAEQQKRKEADKATDAKGGGGPPPKKPTIKQPSDMTPEEEALSFDDPMMATG